MGDLVPLLELLVDPETKDSLRLDGQQLVGAERSFPLADGIPRFSSVPDVDQRQTEESFGFKWQQTSTYGSGAMTEFAQTWLAERYGFGTIDQMRQWFAGRRRILDAGCGSGYSAGAWLQPGWSLGRAMWVGVDISSAIDVARDRLGGIERTYFVQADVMNLPFAEGTFDTIFSEGVLHHTPDTRAAFDALIPLLSPGGEIMVYVYRRKAPAREFVDDHVRSLVSRRPPAEAWEELRSLTRLGQALAELNVEVDVPEAVPLLGIESGRYTIQRLIYWHFAKLFWNESFSFEENHHVNFDWYHPRYAHRHTPEEVDAWVAEAGLRVVHRTVEPSGITIRAAKQ
jgi:SAM-dependent methyltransferase